MKLRKGGVAHIGLKKKLRQNSQSKAFFIIAIVLLIYLVLSILLVKIRDSIIQESVLHLKVILAVFMVLIEIKHGYLISLLVTSFSFLLSVISFFTVGKEQVIHAVITYVATLVIISLIHKYRVNLAADLKSAIKHNKRAEVLVQELQKKNKQLLKLNKAMKEKEKQLSQLAYYDILTGIPNREMLISQMEILISMKKKFSVVFIDLDNFKKINDTMGHQKGDSLLRAVTKRINEYIHHKDVLGRLGGDEFALIIKRDLTKGEILSYVDGLRQLLMSPFGLNKTDINISASFGISVYPKDGKTSSELLKFSDIAMYQAKDTGKNSIEFFTVSMNDELVKNLEFKNHLKKALENREFYLLFQPQYNVVTKRLRGFEALVRWDSPKYGIIYPKDFIPLAEKLDYIIPIGEWILKTACQTLRIIQDTFEVVPMMSINISKKQLLDSTFFDMVNTIIKETGVNSEYLEFDLEEALFHTLEPSVIEVIRNLRMLGIRIAMDNYGAVLSSLGSFESLAFHTVKIDKSLIDAISVKSEKKEIIQSFISLMHQLGIMVIAEGVETEEQLEYLCDSSCDMIQGYLWGKPMEQDQMLLMSQQVVQTRIAQK